MAPLDTDVRSTYNSALLCATQWATCALCALGALQLVLQFNIVFASPNVCAHKEICFLLTIFLGSFCLAAALRLYNNKSAVLKQSIIFSIRI
jgi:Trk-type K+ transport system membrane component